MIWYLFVFCRFFFFKQKTAYEMRISDWSSDVCSSDLVPGNSVSGHPLTGSPAGSIAHGQAALPLASFVPEGAAGDMTGARAATFHRRLAALLHRDGTGDRPGACATLDRSVRGRGPAPRLGAPPGAVPPPASPPH